MNPRLEISARVVREGFAEAAGYRRRADALPRWRWLKRHNLRVKADIAERGVTLFWMRKKVEVAFETFVDQHSG